MTKIKVDPRVSLL